MERINCEAQKSRLFLPDAGRDYALVLKEYLHPEEYFDDESFVTATGGDGNTNVFREYLHSYIKDFRPVYFLPDKSAMLSIKKDGEFSMTRLKNRKQIFTKEENIVFQYLCYLYINIFWKGFESMRDIHYVSEPLIVYDFSEELKDKRYFKKLISMTKLMGNRIITQVYRNKAISL